MTKYISRVLVLMTAAIGAGCTMTDIDPPPLAGPSEMSLSLAITANPDVLSLDGSSQTLITIEARDTNGQPAPNVPLRVEILADGQTRRLRDDLRAHAGHRQQWPRDVYLHGALVYQRADSELQLSVTPTGTDASAHVRRRRYRPAGAARRHRRAPNRALYVRSGEPRRRLRTCASTDRHRLPGLARVITGYLWDFGDGTSGTGVTATHRYTRGGKLPGAADGDRQQRRTNQSAAQAMTVGSGAAPTATFVFSPTAPLSGQTVFFNGTPSTAGAGHRIVSYRWNWGDGKPRAVVRRCHTRLRCPGRTSSC